MNSPDRLRVHPEERLASPSQLVELTAAASALRAEPHAPVSGHRQMTVARHGPVTVILFAFDRDGQLKEHQAEGAVLLQVLRGRLQVMADKDAHTLGPGALLVLASGVPHSVRALEATDMLLTVHRLPMVPGTA